MDACKALGRGGLAHLVTDALRDTRLVCGERLVPAVLTKEEREAELQAVKVRAGAESFSQTSREPKTTWEL
jgi:hypothetical protein